MFVVAFSEREFGLSLQEFVSMNTCNNKPNSITNPHQDEPNSPSLKATTNTENSEQEENDKK